MTQEPHSLIALGAVDAFASASKNQSASAAAQWRVLAAANPALGSRAVKLVRRSRALSLTGQCCGTQVTLMRVACVYRVNVLQIDLIDSMQSTPRVPSIRSVYVGVRHACPIRWCRARVAHELTSLCVCCVDLPSGIRRGTPAMDEVARACCRSGNLDALKMAAGPTLPSLHMNTGVRPPPPSAPLPSLYPCWQLVWGLMLFFLVRGRRRTAARRSEHVRARLHARPPCGGVRHGEAASRHRQRRSDAVTVRLHARGTGSQGMHCPSRG